MLLGETAEIKHFIFYSGLLSQLCLPLRLKLSKISLKMCILEVLDCFLETSLVQSLVLPPNSM